MLYRDVRAKKTQLATPTKRTFELWPETKAARVSEEQRSGGAEDTPRVSEKVGKVGTPFC